MGVKTELIKIFDDLPDDKKKQALKLIRNISLNHDNQSNVLRPNCTGLKNFLLSMPDFGEDADFERSKDFGRSDMLWDS